MIVIANTLEEVVQFLNKNFKNSSYSIENGEVVEVSPNLENPLRWKIEEKPHSSGRKEFHFI